MDWKKEHEHRVAGFADDVRTAHTHSSHHRSEINASRLCGCFYCLAQFSPDAIEEWVDEDASGSGTTAICPECGIDSVIGDASGFPVNAEFLQRMKAAWFGDA